jgi:hypothetical protein
MTQIYLHEIVHALSVSQDSRPRPIPGGDGMTAIPVTLSLWARMPDGRRTLLELPITRQYLIPYSPATSDYPLQTAEYILTASLPSRYTITDTQEPPSSAVQPTPEARPEAATGIPELAHYAPEVFAPNTTRPAGHYDKTDKMSDEYKNMKGHSDE